MSVDTPTSAANAGKTIVAAPTITTRKWFMEQPFREWVLRGVSTATE
jgi:hypothetical protein